MPTEHYTRSTLADLEVRSDGRTIVGLAVPFDQPTDIGQYVETFRFGAFTRTIVERGSKVRLLSQHVTTANPLGRATLLREDARGLVIEARVSETQAGTEALALIADGALDGLSIGFTPVRDNWSTDRRNVDRLEVKLHEVSLVTFQAFESAKVLASRA